jgi:hypothetical protein
MNRSENVNSLFRNKLSDPVSNIQRKVKSQRMPDQVVLNICIDMKLNPIIFIILELFLIYLRSE